MKKVFILQNQHKSFLNKHSEWVDGRDANTLFRTPHKDEALNQMFEASSKDYTQRVQLLECPLNERNIPVIAEEHLPPVMAPAPAEDAIESEAHSETEFTRAEVSEPAPAVEA